MATVTLPFSGGRFRVGLPRNCLVCGEAGCSFKNVTFSSRFIKKTIGPFGQEWRRTLSMSVPLCEEHWGYFDMQFLRALGCMGVVVLFMFVLAIASFSVVGTQIFGASALLGLVVAALLAGLGIFLAVLLLRGATSQVMCQNITEKSITLINVHRKFAKAVESGDTGEAGDDEEDRGGKGSRRKKSRRPDEDVRPPSYAGVWIGVGVGVLVILLACGGVVTGFRWWLERNMAQLPGPGPAPGPAQPQDPANPLPINPNWRDADLKPQFLADLKEYDVSIGWGTLGKGTAHGFGIPGVGAEQNLVLVNKRPATKALAMVPENNGISRVKYRLDDHKLLLGTAAMADLHPANPQRQAATPFTCSIHGDGRLLWRSKPLQKPGDVDSFRLSVQGVKELEMRVTCPGSAHAAWSVWFDPYLLK